MAHVAQADFAAISTIATAEHDKGFTALQGVQRIMFYFDKNAIFSDVHQQSFCDILSQSSWSR